MRKVLAVLKVKILGGEGEIGKRGRRLSGSIIISKDKNDIVNCITLEAKGELIKPDSDNVTLSTV